jgi:hypothetical protein
MLGLGTESQGKVRRFDKGPRQVFVAVLELFDG